MPFVSLNAKAAPVSSVNLSLGFKPPIDTATSNNAAKRVAFHHPLRQLEPQAQSNSWPLRHDYSAQTSQPPRQTLDGDDLQQPPLTRHGASDALGTVFPAIGGMTSFCGPTGYKPLQLRKRRCTPITSTAMRERASERRRGLLGGGGWGRGGQRLVRTTQAATGADIIDGGFTASPSFLTECPVSPRESPGRHSAAEGFGVALPSSIPGSIPAGPDVSSGGAVGASGETLTLRPLVPRLRDARTGGAQRVARQRDSRKIWQRRVLMGKHQSSASEMLARLQLPASAHANY